MKYGGGFPLAESSRIPRASSSASTPKPGGFGAPPPESGSTRTTSGGAAGRPGVAAPDDAACRAGPRAAHPAKPALANPARTVAAEAQVGEIGALSKAGSARERTRSGAGTGGFSPYSISSQRRGLAGGGPGPP